MTIKVTKPDGTTETLGPFTADDTGGTYAPYTPTQLGNYTFQMSYPGQNLTGANPPPAGYSAAVKAYIGDYYQPSTSDSSNLNSAANTHPNDSNNSASNKLLDPPSSVRKRHVVNNNWQLAWTWFIIQRQHRNVQCNRKLQSIHNCTKNSSHHVDKTHSIRWFSRRRIWGILIPATTIQQDNTKECSNP